MIYVKKTKLIKFFLNPGTSAYLRELASEFKESTNSVRVELNRLSEAKIIKTENVGRTIEYRANAEHSLFNELRSLVRKYSGVDNLVEKLIKKTTLKFNDTFQKHPKQTSECCVPTK